MPRFRPDQTPTEAGYLLATSAVIILIIVALVGSFAFVMKRQSHFQGNYAAGERLASLATMAHFYAQNQVYGEGVSITGNNLLPDMNLPDNFAFAPVENTKFSVEIRGIDKAPMDAATNIALKAASAYIHLSMRTGVNGARPPSDDVALQSGASNHGMARLGYYGIGFPAGDKCDGENTVVRWGSEDSDCLNDKQVGNGAGMLNFNDLQQGDIIVPVWETALAQNQNNNNAVLRYPQPLRLASNAMSAGIDMGTHKIENVGNATTDNLTTATPAAGTTKFNNGVVINSDATFAGLANMNTTLDVQDTTGNSQVMTVNGIVNFNGNLMIGNDLKSTGDLAVNSQQPLNIATLGDDATNTQIKPIPGNALTVATRNISAASGNPLTKIDMRGANSRLAISDELNTQNAPLKNYGAKLDIYTAQINTPTTGTTNVYNGTGNVTWNIQSLVQSGNTAVQGIKADRMVINSCFGTACPLPDDSGGGL